MLNNPCVTRLQHTRPLFLQMLLLGRCTKAPGNMAGSMYCEKVESMLHVGAGQ